MVLLQVQTPAALQEQLKQAMQEASIPVPDGEERWQEALRALKVCAPAPRRVQPSRIMPS